MNLKKIVTMVSRVLLLKGVHWGIKKGTQAVAKRGKTATPASPVAGGHGSPARDAAKRARKAAAVTRRIGR